MASSYSRIQGITIQVGADTTDLVKALKAVDTELRTTQSALNDVNNLLKLDPKNTELLQQKQKLLGTAIADTKAKLEKEKEALAQLKQKDSTPEVVDQMERLERQIEADEQQLQKFEKEFQEFGSVGKQQAEAVAKQLEEIGSSMVSVGKKLSTYVTAPIVAGFTAASKVASDYEENINKMNVAFGESAKTVKEFTDNAMTGFGLSKVAASDAASSFGAMAKGVGLSNEQAAEMAITLTGLTADLGSYFNASNDVAQTALESVFTGNAQALKKFGVVMTETNLQQYAKDQKLVYERLSNTEKVLLRYNYVLAQTADASGDYERTNDGLANSVKTCQAALQDLATALGEQLLPIVTPIIQGITEAINKLANLPEPIQKVIVYVGLIAAAIGPLLIAGGQLLIGIGSLIKYAPAAVAAIKGVTTATTVGCAASVASIGLYVAAIAAAAVAFYLIVKAIDEHWEEIVGFFKKGFDTISKFLKDFGTGFVNGFKNVFITIATIASNIVNTVVSAFRSMINFFSGIGTSIYNAIVGGFQRAWSGVTSVLSGIADTIRNFVVRIGNWLDASTWSLPRIKLPHFRINWKDIGGIIRLPLVSVEWYRKAYETPYLFTDPTVMGVRGFGDGGGSGEIVYGRDQLMRDIAEASNGNTTINIYASDGMNVNQLADKVQQRLAQLQKQRMNAYA